MRAHETLQQPAKVAVDPDGLFEMANLRQQQTGVAGTIYISTAQASHGPRVKHYVGRPGDQVPYFAVSIGPTPEIIDVRGLSDRDVNVVKDDVIAWVGLNHEKLHRFWFEGTTWFDDEVNAFKRSLTKLGRKRRRRRPSETPKPLASSADL